MKYPLWTYPSLYLKCIDVDFRHLWFLAMYIVHEVSELKCFEYARPWYMNQPKKSVAEIIHVLMTTKIDWLQGLRLRSTESIVTSYKDERLHLELFCLIIRQHTERSQLFTQHPLFIASTFPPDFTGSLISSQIPDTQNRCSVHFSWRDDQRLVR